MGTNPAAGAPPAGGLRRQAERAGAWPPRVHRSGRRFRTAARSWLVALLGAVGAGCYVYRPIAGPLPLGGRIAVALNDRGRIALTDSLGGFVDRAEGTLDQANDSLIVLRVISVQFLSGRSVNWTHEPVTIRREYIRDMWERRFSRGRTMFASAGAVGALIAFIGSRTLFGGGHSPSEPPEPPPQGQ